MAETDIPARWARASQKAEDVADHGMHEPLTAYFRLYVPIGAVVLGVLGFLASSVWLEGDPLHSKLAIVFTAAALAAMIGGLFYASRRIKPKVTLAGSTPLYGLEDAEQKSVHRQILGKEIPVPEQLAVVRGVAVESRYAMAKQLVMLPGQFLLWAGLTANLLPGSSGLWLLLLIPILLMFVWTLVESVRRYRRIGAFLDDTRDASEQDNARPSSPS